MNFQQLIKIETPDTYLDIAFRRGKEAVANLKIGKMKTMLDKRKDIEIVRITSVRISLGKLLSRILVSFPSIDELEPFYLELVKISLDYSSLKKSLGAVNWANKKINDFFRHYVRKIKITKDMTKIMYYKREFYGRVASALKQIKKELQVLENARRVMKNFPTIKTKLFTVAITGFPNVGKTTLLYKLTGSKPEINDYAFTTKSINISYFLFNKKRIQVLDTPGSLNRFEKMNNIEKQAQLALKHGADLMVYVFDPTEPYPLKDQKKLLLNIRKFNKPIITYISKTDVVDRKTVESFEKKFKTISSVEELKKRITENI